VGIASGRKTGVVAVEGVVEFEGLIGDGSGGGGGWAVQWEEGLEPNGNGCEDDICDSEAVEETFGEGVIGEEGGHDRVVNLDGWWPIFTYTKLYASHHVSL